MKLEFTIDAHCWAKKWSTWLALASAMATAALGAYALMPERVQGLIPDWLLLPLGGIAMGAALLIPLATSLQQSSIPKAGGE